MLNHLCTFLRHGSDDFGYKFWDDHNRKFIRSIDVVLDEKVMYKSRDIAKSTSLVQPEPIYFEPDDVLVDVLVVKIVETSQLEEIDIQEVEKP